MQRYLRERERERERERRFPCVIENLGGRINSNFDP